MAPFVDVGLDALSVDGCIAVLHEVRDPGTPARCFARPMPRAPTASCSPRPRSTRTTRRPSGVGGVAVPPADRPRRRDARPRSRRARDRGLRILAMDGHGDEDLYTVDLSGPAAFVFGNEAHGLPEEVLAMADARVRVPHRGRAESLNLAAAATVCLFEWARRRHSGAVALETIIAAAAHDIRSPLTAMKGFGYALEKRWDHDRRAANADAPGIVYDADRMDTILRQLVDAGRVAAGALELFPERVDLSEFALGIIASVRVTPSILRFAGRAKRTSSSPIRLARRARILSFIESQVWWGREGRSRSKAKRVDDRLHLTVWREGTELTTEDAERLFEARVPARRREQDRPVRCSGRRGGARRSRMGGGERRTARRSTSRRRSFRRAEQGRLLDSAA